MNIPQVALDQVEEIQHTPKANSILNALSSSALFGVMQRRSRGRDLWLYGGTFLTLDAGPIKLANQHFVLTASATNYIYVLTDGTVQRDTSPPTGWPGPMSNGARALYELDVGTNAITDGTCYLLSRSVAGPTGVKGATGAAGDELWKQRARWAVVVGGNDGGFTPTAMGLNVSVGSANNRDISTSTFSGSVPYVAIDIYRSTENFLCRTRGFEVFLRWGDDGAFTTTAHRSFFGMYDASGGSMGTTNPSTLTNLFGVGSDATDTTLYLIHNDGSGSATKTQLVSDSSPSVTFPSGGADRVFELAVWCDEGDTGLNYVFSDHLGNSKSGFITSDIPASTQFLGWITHRNQAAGGTARNGLMQVSVNSRY